jgi:hypothetical protein
MNGNSQKSFEDNGGRHSHPPSRSPVILGIIIVAVVVVAALFLLRKRGSPSVETSGATPTPTASTTTPERTPATSAPKTETAHTPASQPATTPPSPTPAAPSTPTAPAPADTATSAPKAEPSSYTRTLVGNLASIDLSQKAIAPEQATAWRQGLEDLVKRGTESVPAILEYLGKNQDVSFAGVAGANAIGYDSYRSALIDAMAAIGGQDGLQGLVTAMQGNTNPRDIAQIADNLEKLDPGQHRQAAIDAARAALAKASPLDPKSPDVGPLFEVLTKYGGADVVPDFEKAAGHWKYYSTIALGNLPDGAGVPALIQMAQDQNSGNSAAAIQVLAQMAANNQLASDVLIAQARAGQITMPTWITVASVLSGHQFQIGSVPQDPTAPGAITATDLKSWHLAFGNQNFYSKPNAANWTPEDVTKRTALIDQLLGVSPPEAVRDLLQQAREQAQGRIPSATPSTPAPQK